jgi:type I restriction enzyme S subunit
MKTDVISETEFKITEDAVRGSSTNIIPKGNIVIATRVGLGKACLLAHDTATNQDLKGIIPKESSKKLLVGYLFQWFKSISQLIQDEGTGATVQGVKLPFIKSLIIPIPPIKEQQRIVGILDEAFEGIAIAKANAEKNLHNARALFESHLQAVFSQRGEGWVEKRLGDVVTRLTNGYVGPTRNIYQESGVPYLLARHVKNNQLTFDGKTFVSDEFNHKNKKSMLKAGDVLLVQSGHIGHSAVVTGEHEGHNCHAMIVITPKQGSFIGPFLSLFFNTLEMRQKFQEIRSGSTVPHLTCGEVRELMIPLPDLSTQHQLVDLLQQFESETQRLESIYQQKLAALDALKKSLLDQAFRGELSRIP